MVIIGVLFFKLFCQTSLRNEGNLLFLMGVVFSPVVIKKKLKKQTTKEKIH